MKQARARIFALTISLALSICVGGRAFAAVGDDPRLGQLENKFYKHTFPKDDDATRLDRLEKMIFGEAKSGSDADRLKALADTVPNLGAIAQDADTDTGSDTGAGSGRPSGRKPVAANNSALDLSEERTQATRRAGESQYPAVTAIEEKLFNRNYVSEPVNDRLNRLETKVFGRPSKFTDLSERVDALKEKTAIDVAKSRPAGSDWIDDDDEDAYPQPNRGRDIAEGTGYGGGSGSYGMAPVPSGIDGGSDRLAQAPRTAPPRQRQRQAPPDNSADDTQAPPPTSPVALSAQVTALEQAVLGEPGSGPLVDRVAKLEKAVFAEKASANASLPMPERIAKLVQKVPIASAKTAKNRLAQGRRRSAQSMSMDDDDLDNMDSINIGSGMGSSMSSGGGMTMMQGSKPPGGLSKIINGIGNMLGAGYSTGYYLPSTSYRDAATGFPVDGMGNIINPTTGAIVGRSTNYGGMSGSVSSFGGLGAGYVNPMMPTYGMGGMGMGMPYGGFGSNYYNTPVYGNPYNGYSGGYSGFNNGFAPYGSRGGINFGGMGGGMRIGF